MCKNVHRNTWGCRDRDKDRERDQDRAIPNAVILSLQVIIDTVDQIAEETSIDGLGQLVSVLLWHLYSVASSNPVTWHNRDNMLCQIVWFMILWVSFNIRKKAVIKTADLTYSITHIYIRQWHFSSTCFWGNNQSFGKHFDRASLLMCGETRRGKWRQRLARSYLWSIECQRWGRCLSHWCTPATFQPLWRKQTEKKAEAKWMTGWKHQISILNINCDNIQEHPFCSPRLMMISHYH